MLRRSSVRILVFALAVTVLGVGCGLLAWIEGLTPRAIARSLKR